MAWGIDGVELSLGLKMNEASCGGRDLAGEKTRCGLASCAPYPWSQDTQTRENLQEP